MIGPFRCNPIYHKKIWGGRWFQEALNRPLPDSDPYGESWELSCRPEAMSVIADGPFQGKMLSELLKEKPVELLGERGVQKGIDPFPLLIKFLDANDNLSVQVHPDNLFAQKRMLGDQGKHEMWYIMDAEPGASIILGLQPGVTREQLVEHIQTGRIVDCFNQIPVTAGDTFFIPAGTVHALLKGIRLVEIQQNSDTTFRIYDWERLGLDGRPRELHIDDALQVIDYTPGEFRNIPGVVVTEVGCTRKILVACPHFAVEELVLADWQSTIARERFEVWTVLEGAATLQWEAGKCDLRKGDTWIIPAWLANFTLCGWVKLLKTYIPDIDNEIKLSLLEQGCDEADWKRIGGLN